MPSDGASLLGGDPGEYQLHYAWSPIGPTPWGENSIVTAQVDLESRDQPDNLWPALLGWWGERHGDDGADLEDVRYEGGCAFPRPVRRGPLVRMWIVSSGQDAFDSIHHYAQELRRVAVAADPDVRLVWTELSPRAARP